MSTRSRAQDAPATPEPAETQRRRRTRAPETRRGDLMDAAERLFLQKGLAATSIDEVAAAAQVAKGTFYLYFDSKEDLLAALQQRFVESFCARVQQALDRHRADRWKARLQTWVETSLNTYLDQVALHDVIFHQYRAEDRRLMGDNPVVAQLAGLLADGAAAGAWSAPDPRLLAVIMFHSMHGVADDAINARTTTQRKRLVRLLAEAFERILQPA